VDFVELRSRSGAPERLAVWLEPARGGGGAGTILYLHGFGSRQSGEKATFFRARALADGFAFCSFDFRGHGASEGSLRELTLSRNLEDLATVRAHLAARGHERVFLFGSSVGGATALWHAARHPESTLAAACIAPAVGMLAGLERSVGAEGLARWRNAGELRFRNELGESDLGWALVEDLRDYPVDELARALRTPTLVFQGWDDATVDWRDVADFARRARPGVVTLRLFEGSGHRLVERLETLWREASAHFTGGAAGRGA